jgi:DNA-directed RNA polymerase II subunit RPB2
MSFRSVSETKSNSNNSLFSEEHIWKVMEAYAESNSLVEHQITSFNDFVTFGMQEIVNQNSTIIFPTYKIKFGEISLSHPQIIEENRVLKTIYPNEARLKDLNYDSAICLNITEVFFDKDNKKEKKHHNKVVIGRMPVMLKSCVCNLSSLRPEEQIEKGECPNDLGGYFIIKGNERVLVAQMRTAYNNVNVYPHKKTDQYLYFSESRSMSSETSHSISIKCLLQKDNRTLVFSLPYISTPIPVGIVFKAFGYTDEDIVNLFRLQDYKDASRYIKFILRDSFVCKTQEEALKYIGEFPINIIEEEKKKDYAWQIVENEMLPHTGISGNKAEQVCFLANMVRKLILTAIKERPVDDRDNYSNKRADVAGNLIYDIFRHLFKKYVEGIRSYYEKRKHIPDIISIVSKSKIISKGLHQCFATGNWCVQRNASYVKMGVSQILDRMTFASSLSHLRRVIVPESKEGKNIAMSQIHPTSFGMLCPCETPEGQKVGLVLNLSITAKLTKKISLVDVKRVIEDIKSIIQTKDMELAHMKDSTPVFLNGSVIGFTQFPEETIEELRKYRKIDLLDKEVSISFDKFDNDIKIYCDEGRFIRPLFKLENNELKIEPKEKYKWKKLIKRNIVQYVDASELENSVIAMTPEYLSEESELYQESDHCEIHPSVMLGVLASMIPFPDHNQSPRNCYQCSMGKQALGIPTKAYNTRTDTLIHVLQHPQKPLVFTKYAKIFRLNEMPCGINSCVAVMPYTGYNQEDSLMLNLSSNERGLFCLTSYHTIDASEKKRGTYSYEEICFPPDNNISVDESSPLYYKRKNANYNLLGEDGIVMVRNRTGGAVFVKKGDVIVGKVLINGSKDGKETKIDDSVVIQPGEEGFVDRVEKFITPDGHVMVKVVIRVNREPKLGDKMASRSAQKGTIGMMYRQEDMPFVSSGRNKGCVPDIIMNPLAFPSRMTIGQLIECALGKEACISGNYKDATPFTENSVNVADKYKKEMEKYVEEGLINYGFSSSGWETMINGMTGETIQAKIFYGPTFYQRLKHMVDDKMHARARGHVTTLTRQPLDGRAKEGGLRFGEMERDCMISHGNSRMTKERLFEVSDAFQVTVCSDCGIITGNSKECQACRKNKIESVNIPYASKLMFSELSALGIKASLKPEVI